MTAAYLLFVILTLLLVALVGVATVRTNRLLATWPLDQNPLLLPGETLVRLVLIGLCIGLGFLSGLSHAALGWRWGPIWPQFLAGTLAGLVIAAFYTLATRALIALGGARYYSTRIVQIIVPRRPKDFPAVAAAMFPVVVMEELLFRSLMIGGLATLLPAEWLVIASALVFGLLHSPQGWWGMIGVSLGGLILGVMFLATESLLLPIWTHYVINMAQLVVAYRLGPPRSTAMEP